MNSVRDDAICAGLPHSDIPGSKVTPTSPGLFAGCHVLHRLLVPRHPPNALPILENKRPYAGTNPTSPKLTQNANPKNPFPSAGYAGSLNSTVVRKNSASKSLLCPSGVGRGHKAAWLARERSRGASMAQSRPSADAEDRSKLPVYEGLIKICWELPTTNRQRQLTARSQKPIHNHNQQSR